MSLKATAVAALVPPPGGEVPDSCNEWCKEIKVSFCNLLVQDIDLTWNSLMQTNNSILLSYHFFLHYQSCS